MTGGDIEILARLLDGDPFADADTETRSFARVAEALQGRPNPVAADPGFRDSLRARLLQEANGARATRAGAGKPTLGSEEGSETDPRRPRGPVDDEVDDTVVLRPAPGRWGRRGGGRGLAGLSGRAAAAAVAAVVVVTGGGVAVAAEASGPGDALYGVKLALEDVRVAVERQEGERGLRRLAGVDVRLTEAEEAVQADQPTAAARALRAADDATRRGVVELLRGTGGVEAVPTVESWAPPRVERVTLIGESATGPAADASADLLVSIQRAAELVGRVQGDCDVEPALPGDFAIPPADQPFDGCPGGGDTTRDGDVEPEPAEAVDAASTSRRLPDAPGDAPSPPRATPGAAAPPAPASVPGPVPAAIPDAPTSRSDLRAPDAGDPEVPRRPPARSDPGAAEPSSPTVPVPRDVELGEGDDDDAPPAAAPAPPPAAEPQVPSQPEADVPPPGPDVPPPVPVEDPDPPAPVPEPVDDPTAPVEDAADDVTEPVDDVTPPVDDVTEPIDDVAPPVDDVTEPIDDVAPPVDDVTEPIDDVVPPVDDVAPPVDDVTEPVDDATAPVEDLLPGG